MRQALPLQYVRRVLGTLTICTRGVESAPASRVAWFGGGEAGVEGGMGGRCTLESCGRGEGSQSMGSGLSERWGLIRAEVGPPPR